MFGGMKNTNKPITTAMNDTAMLTQRIVEKENIGTNLGLYRGLMALQGGHLLASRGGLIPALTSAGLNKQESKQTWQAIAQGKWEANQLLAELNTQIKAAGKFKPTCVAGYQIQAADTLGYFRARLKGCKTGHYNSIAGKSLPAQCFGILGVVGSIGQQRVTLPFYLARAEGETQSDEQLMKRLLHEANKTLDSEIARVTTADRKFPPLEMLKAGYSHIVLRRPKNFTMIRAELPVYKGKGRRPSKGEVIRPMIHQYKGKVIPESEAEAVHTWQRNEVDGRCITLNAKIWFNVLLPAQKTWTQSDHHLNQKHLWVLMAIQHPDFEHPLILIMTNIKLTPDEAYTIFKSRWGIEQPPLVAKQLLGAHRQFVHHPEMCFRLPEFSMIAAVILTYCAACQPACPTGYWDRKPKPTAGRLRRHLSDFDFAGIPLLPRLREKRSVTSHLPTGYHPALALARAQKAVFSEN